MPRDSSPGSDRSLPAARAPSSKRVRAAVEIGHGVEPRDEPQMLLDRQILEEMRLVGHEGQPPLRLDRRRSPMS